MNTPRVEFQSEINILINILGCFNSFFLSLYQWKFRRIFQEFQGLRQGDPLSPYLCLGNESLLSLNREGGLNRILIGLQNNEYKRYKGQVLWFEAISVLRINLEKSIVLEMGGVQNLDELALELGCKTWCIPTTYLGLPLGMRRNSISM